MTSGFTHYPDNPAHEKLTRAMQNERTAAMTRRINDVIQHEGYEGYAVDALVDALMRRLGSESRAALAAIREIYHTDGVDAEETQASAGELGDAAAAIHMRVERGF